MKTGARAAPPAFTSSISSTGTAALTNQRQVEFGEHGVQLSVRRVDLSVRYGTVLRRLDQVLDGRDCRHNVLASLGQSRDNGEPFRHQSNNRHWVHFISLRGLR